jgi:hypothetical protein
MSIGRKPERGVSGTGHDIPRETEIKWVLSSPQTTALACFLLFTLPPAAHFFAVQPAANPYLAHLQPITDKSPRISPTRVLLCVRRRSSAPHYKGDPLKLASFRDNATRSGRAPSTAPPVSRNSLRLALFRQFSFRPSPAAPNPPARPAIGFVPPSNFLSRARNLRPKLGSFRKTAGLGRPLLIRSLITEICYHTIGGGCSVSHHS